MGETTGKIRAMKGIFSVLGIWLSVFGSLAFAQIPDCLDNQGQVLEVNNAQVLEWKKTTKNQYKNRAHVTGTALGTYPDPGGDHTHIQVKIGDAESDTIELIYNNDFGDLPEIEAGMAVEACGDYITSFKQAGSYPPSPDGAIIHWLHVAKRGKSHPDGYLALDNVLYGQGRGRNLLEVNPDSQTNWFEKAMIVVFENTNAEDASKLAFFSELATHGANFSQFHAITHPSQPNYLAMISGSTHGVFTNGKVNIDAPTIVDLLEKKGLTWKAYVEGWPGNCYTGSQYEAYARKHNPFISFTSISQNPERCAKIVNASELSKDVETGQLPNFSMYVPDMNNSGHDTDAEHADRWYQKTFRPLIDNPLFMKGMLLITTFDESESYFSDNRIYTSFYGAMVKPGFDSPLTYDHIHLLKTLQVNWGLEDLGQDDVERSAIRDVFQTSAALERQ